MSKLAYGLFYWVWGREYRVFLNDVWFSTVDRIQNRLVIVTFSSGSEAPSMRIFVPLEHPKTICWNHNVSCISSFSGCHIFPQESDLESATPQEEMLPSGSESVEADKCSLPTEPLASGVPGSSSQLSSVLKRKAESSGTEFSKPTAEAMTRTLTQLWIKIL